MVDNDLKVIEGFYKNTKDFNKYSTLIECAIFRTNYRNLSYEFEERCKFRLFSSYMAAFFNPIMTAFGLFVNIMSIYYFNKNPKQSRQKVFMISLAVSDIMANIFWVYIHLFPAVGLPFISGGKYYWILNSKSDLMCKFTFTMIYFWQEISFLILLFCSIDRFLSIMMPLESRNWSYKYAIFVIFGAILWNTLSCIPHLLMLHINYNKINNKYDCSSKGFRNMNALYLFYTSLFHPFGMVYIVINILVNIKLIKTILNHSKATRNFERNKEAMKRSQMRNSEIKSCIQIFFLSTFTFCFIFTMKCCYYFSLIVNTSFSLKLEVIGINIEILYIGSLNINFLPILVKQLKNKTK